MRHYCLPPADAPVEIAEATGFHEPLGKRHKGHDFRYALQAPTNSAGPATARQEQQGDRPIKPIRVQSSAQSEQLGLASSQCQGAENGGGTKQNQPAAAVDNGLSAQIDTPVEASQAEIRRFHMSRLAASANTSMQAGKKRSAHIFVERCVRKTPKTSARATPSLPEEPPRTQKKPGASARTAPRTAGTPAKPTEDLPPTQRLPPALVNPWGVKEDELAAQMQAYTLEEIGRSIAESTPEPPPADRLYKAAQGRYKPKKPVQRYHERNPGTELPGPAMVAEDEEDVCMDEDEYIIDTYVRMPVGELEDQGQRKFGLLVLESQPDIDEFYREEEDSDTEEEYEGDEDENGMLFLLLSLSTPSRTLEPIHHPRFLLGKR